MAVCRDCCANNVRKGRKGGSFKTRLLQDLRTYFKIGAISRCGGHAVSVRGCRAQLSLGGGSTSDRAAAVTSDRPPIYFSQVTSDEKQRRLLMGRREWPPNLHLL